MSVLTNFEKWKEFLNKRVDSAESKGMSEETISNLAYEIGDFLSDKIDPKNSEERLLKELWDAGDEQDQKTIAKLMVRLVDKEG